MSYGAYPRELLRPLRIYGLEGTANGGELEAQGKALDEAEAAMEGVQREMLICTAEGRGPEVVKALLARKPVAASLEWRRAAPAAPLRIGGDSFTLTTINDNLKGCGLSAVTSETKTPGVVEVRSPNVPGIPDGFESMRATLEDILPYHLDIRYVYWYITWALMKERFVTWGDIEKLRPAWEELEKMVRDQPTCRIKMSETMRFQEDKNQKVRDIRACSRFLAEPWACFPLCFPLRAKIGLYETLHMDGVVLLHVFREVTVSIQSKGRAGVVEVALDGLDIIAGSNSANGIGVSEVVETDTNQSGRSQSGTKLEADRGQTKGATDIIGKHKLARAIP